MDCKAHIASRAYQRHRKEETMPIVLNVCEHNGVYRIYNDSRGIKITIDVNHGTMDSSAIESAIKGIGAAVSYRRIEVDSSRHILNFATRALANKHYEYFEHIKPVNDFCAALDAHFKVAKETNPERYVDVHNTANINGLKGVLYAWPQYFNFESKYAKYFIDVLCISHYYTFSNFSIDENTSTIYPIPKHTRYINFLYNCVKRIANGTVSVDTVTAITSNVNSYNFIGREFLMNLNEEIRQEIVRIANKSFKKREHMIMLCDMLEYGRHNISIVQDAKEQFTKYLIRTMLKLFNDYGEYFTMEEIKSCNSLQSVGELNYNVNMRAAEAKRRQLNEAIENLSAKITEIDSTYAVVFPKEYKDFEHEAYHQQNCVRGYYKDYMNGKTGICFVRKIADIRQPYITVEFNINTGKIIQFLKKNNSSVTDERDIKLRYALEKALQSYFS